MRPGITGLAQVNGRTELDWENRLALDVYYVDHRLFALDAQIGGEPSRRPGEARGSVEGIGDRPGVPRSEDRVDICPVTSEPVGDRAQR